jgi:hypothetical protein
MFKRTAMVAAALALSTGGSAAAAALNARTVNVPREA